MSFQMLLLFSQLSGATVTKHVPSGSSPGCTADTGPGGSIGQALCQIAVQTKQTLREQDPGNSGCKAPR